MVANFISSMSSARPWPISWLSDWMAFFSMVVLMCSANLYFCNLSRFFILRCSLLIMPRPHGGALCIDDRCLSVCLSVQCLTLTRERKGIGNWKLSGGIEAHAPYGWPVTPFRYRKTRSQVQRPINTMTENQPHLRNGKAYEIQSWYTDGVRWPASPTCAVTSKVNGQGYNVTSSVWRVFAHNSTKKSQILAAAVI